MPGMRSYVAKKAREEKALTGVLNRAVTAGAAAAAGDAAAKNGAADGADAPAAPTGDQWAGKGKGRGKYGRRRVPRGPEQA